MFQRLCIKAHLLLMWAVFSIPPPPTHLQPRSAAGGRRRPRRYTRAFCHLTTDSVSTNQRSAQLTAGPVTPADLDAGLALLPGASERAGPCREWRTRAGCTSVVCGLVVTSEWWYCDKECVQCWVTAWLATIRRVLAISAGNAWFPWHDLKAVLSTFLLATGQSRRSVFVSDLWVIMVQCGDSGSG